MGVLVSVVVPTYGRPGLLAHCLNHLVHRDFPVEAYEIIVVDDGSPDAVLEANREVVQRAASIRPGLEVACVDSPANSGPGAARNRGWRGARADVIAFTDDDTRPAPSWLREGLAAIAGFDAVAGRIEVPMPSSPTDYERDVGGLGASEFCHGQCVRTPLMPRGGRRLR